MKYYLMAGFVVVAVAAAVAFSPLWQDQGADAYAHKRDRAEAETKVRPASFAEMKWKEGDEDRAPASKK